MNTYYVEYTDTFGGEANYWIHRFEVPANSAKRALTRAKQELYYSPLPRHTLTDYGDMLRADIGKNVLFISERENAHHSIDDVKEL